MGSSRRLPAVIAAICVACTEPGVGPPHEIRRLTAATFNAVAGSSIPSGVGVKVVDARGKAVSGIRVAFTVTRGDGTVGPHLVVSDAEGNAHAEWTVGTTVGENSLIAWIDGAADTATFTATVTAGAATAVAVVPHTLRIPVDTTTGGVAGTVVDKYGNFVSTGVTFTSRNPSLVTVNATTGNVTVVGGGGTTYIVATSAGFTDSSLVIVLKSTDTPCTGITAHASPAVGAVITTGFSDNGICVDATTSGAEYAWVPYFNSSVASAQTAVTLSVFGIKTAGPLNSAGRVSTRPLADAIAATDLASAAAFHDRLRSSEQRALRAGALNARLWYSAAQTAPRALRSAVIPKVGDRMRLNVNPESGCSSPIVRTGRVAAVTQRAVVVTDTSNAIGFSDPEYQAFGATFDTLVYPLDVATFGAPVDIDDNGGRVIMFFTHAVNEMADGNVIGLFYGRDLLPKVGPLGSCPGSNVGEIVYLRVPDLRYTKDEVTRFTVGTVAHEFQHLINASRRLYVNTTAAPAEERWLNEGLSHVAEELLFYRVSGLKPRQNVGAELFTAQYLQTYSTYQSLNLRRLAEYLKAPASQSPIGVDDLDDDPATRGAIWSYLRYAADQRFSADEPGFWFKLVNSNVTGLENLYGVVGSDARLLMRDWTLAILLDDLVPGIDPRYQQPSWNLRKVTAGYPLSTVPLPTIVSATSLILSAGGTIFARFGVAANQEAYVSAAGSGGSALPKNVLLALVRTK